MELKELLDLGRWFGPALWPALGGLAAGWGVTILINRISLWRKGTRLYWMEETSPHKPEPVRNILLVFTGAMAAAGLLAWFNPPSGISLGLYLLFTLPEKLSKRKWKSRIEVRRLALWYQETWYKMEGLQRVTLAEDTAVLHFKEGVNPRISLEGLEKLMDSHPFVRFRIDRRAYLSPFHADHCASKENPCLLPDTPQNGLSLEDFFRGFPASLALFRRITAAIPSDLGLEWYVTPTWIGGKIGEEFKVWCSIGDRAKGEKTQEPLVLHLSRLPDPSLLTEGPAQRTFLQETLGEGKMLVHLPVKEKKRAGSRFITPGEAARILKAQVSLPSTP